MRLKSQYDSHAHFQSRLPARNCRKIRPNSADLNAVALKKFDCEKFVDYNLCRCKSAFNF